MASKTHTGPKLVPVPGKDERDDDDGDVGDLAAEAETLVGAASVDVRVDDPTADDLRPETTRVGRQVTFDGGAHDDTRKTRVQTRPGVPTAAEEDDDGSFGGVASSAALESEDPDHGGKRKRRGKPGVHERMQAVLDMVAPESAPARHGAVRVMVQVYRSWEYNRPLQQAAALAFETALSVVPMLATAVAIMTATGALEEQSTFVRFLAERVLPMSPDTIANQLVEWAGQLSFQTAGITGLLITLVLSFIMYDSVEAIFNDIWHVEVRRRLAHRFLVFYTLITLVPTFLGFSIYQATRYGLTKGIAGLLMGLAATWSALFFANYLLPNVRVKWSAAAVGALFTAVVFEGTKYLFSLYVSEIAFDRYTGIYGAIGLIPMFLIWVYVSWVVVLVGAAVGHAVQNLEYLERVARSGTNPWDKDVELQVNGTVAARLFCAVVQNWARTGTPLKRARLMQQFGVREEVVEIVFRRLKQARLILEVEGEQDGYLPARPPSEITLAEVIAPFRAADIHMLRPTLASARLDSALGDIEDAIRSKSEDVTIEELALGKS